MEMFPFSEKQFLNYKDIENSLRECDCIKYAAYRTATKLRIIQKALFLNRVQLKVISSVFERHQLLQTENSVQLDEREIQSILSDIYFVTQRESNVQFNIDFVSQLVISFLFNVYDKKMTNTVQVLSLKVGLTLLCQARPREKYSYLFNQLADHNNCLSRKKLEILLKKIISVTESIGEGLSFGFELINGTVESCFQCNIGTLGISEDGFINWLMQDPQLLVWLSTFYRVQISEKILHNIKCKVCKTYPIVGLRYRCLRCLSCDICQSCFFTGKLNKKHKLKHPVQEYCCPMTSQQLTKAFLLTIKNKLYKENSKLQYLPALKVESHDPEIMGQSTRLLDEMEISSRTLINGSRVSLHKFPHKELQNIIFQLENESEKLTHQINNLFLNMENGEMGECQTQLKNYLLKHRNQVKSQVQRLKLLINYLRSLGRYQGRAVVASTPLVDEILSTDSRQINDDLETFSPISRHVTRKKNEYSDKKMMWDNYDLVNRESWEEIKSTPNGGNLFLESANTKDNESVSSVSTWLGGKSLKEMDSSSKRGFTWLGEDNSDNSKIKKENEETFEEIQNDLKQILNKLHELSVVTSQDETLTENTVNKEEEKFQSVSDVDTLLSDLINGIEKLLEPQQ